MWNTPTTEQLRRIPKLYETENIPPNDKIIYLHFFVGACDWYIAEYDGKDTFWGYANLGDSELAEWGNISFSELQELKTYANMIDERGGKELKITVEVDFDLHWTPKRFRDIQVDRRL